VSEKLGLVVLIGKYRPRRNINNTTYGRIEYKYREASMAGSTIQNTPFATNASLQVSILGSSFMTLLLERKDEEAQAYPGKSARVSTVSTRFVK